MNFPLSRQVIICYVCILFVLSAQETVFRFGTENGDKTIGNEDEYIKLQITTHFNFFDRPYDSIFINNNGAISFLSPVHFESIPFRGSPFLTPYFGTVTSERNSGSIWYREVSKQSEPGLQLAVHRIIRDVFVDQQGFVANWFFLVTWDEVPFSFPADNRTFACTFQCALVSDGVFSAVVFNYGDVTSWTNGQVGFNAGDGLNSYTLPAPGGGVKADLSRTSNIGVPGRYVFRVDVSEIKDVACASSGDISIYPTFDSMLGGTEVFISGPCYNSLTNNVSCKFGTRVTPGMVVSQLQAKCVTPFNENGYVNLSVSLDGGTTFPFQSRFQYAMPVYVPPRVFNENEVTWLTPNELTVTWTATALDPPVEYVNVVVYSYFEDVDAGSIRWEKIATLVSNAPYGSGGVVFAKPAYRAMNGTLLGVIAVEEVQDQAPTRLLPRSLWSFPDSLQWLNPLDSLTWCKTWANTEQGNMEFLQGRPPCPCYLQQAFQDFAGYFPLPICDADLWGTRLDNCAARPGAYHCVVARNRSIIDAGQECCYNDEGVLLEDRLSARGFGYAHRYHHAGANPYFRAKNMPFFSHFLHDVIPAMQCCKFPFRDGVTPLRDALTSCGRYKTVRPSKSCAQYRAPDAASMYGTLHLIRPDGTNYTFSGNGEYTLLRSVDRQFVLQGRLERIADNISASALTALAATLDGGDVIFIQPSRLRGLDVFVRRDPEIWKRIDSSQLSLWYFDGVSVTFNHNVTHVGVSLVFANGFGLRVKVSEYGGHLRFIMTTPASYRGLTEGLLGFAATDPPGEFVMSNGQVLPAQSSSEDIFEDFGPSWLIDNDIESLFYYLPGYSTNYYSDTTYTPTFFQSGGVPDDAICASSAFCNFDYHVTSQADIAMVTLLAEREIAELLSGLRTGETDAANSCPRLLASSYGSFANDPAYGPGDQLVFQCEEPFELQGLGNVMTCQDSSLTWDGEPPRCLEAQGDDPFEETPTGVVSAREDFFGFLAILFAVVIILVILAIVYFKRREKKLRAVTASSTGKEMSDSITDPKTNDIDLWRCDGKVDWSVDSESEGRGIDSCA